MTAALSLPRERPILFSGPMVRALLAGTKTQTRRLVTVPWKGSTRALPYSPYYVDEDGTLLVDCSEAPDSMGNADYREFLGCCGSPYGAAGDRLWVRESFAKNHFGDAQPGTLKHGYRADWTGAVADLCPEPRWTPSIHMPRACSRITLEITDVRVERLQAITEEGAIAEGVASNPLDAVEWSARREYQALWDDINAKREPWASNPWVFVVSFRRLP